MGDYYKQHFYKNISMKYLIFSLLASLLLISCNGKKEATIPGPPSSTTAVKEIINGKTFITSRVGTLSAFANGIDKEKPFIWLDDEKESDKFTKDYETERKKFQLVFVNDTTIRITDDGKTWDAVYKLDDAVQEDEKPGIRLRISYEDKEGSMGFPGTTTPMMLTSSYLVAGIGENEMIVEAPRKFNNRPVILWLKRK